MAFGQAGIDLGDLDAVLLTHLHIDHSGGLAPIVFSAYMNERTRPITVAGPAPNDTQPGCREFCDLLFGASGAICTASTDSASTPSSQPATPPTARLIQSSTGMDYGSGPWPRPTG